MSEPSGDGSSGPAAEPTEGGARPDPELFVAPDADQLAAAVTDRLLALVVAAQRARGEASVLVTGGRVMGKVLSTLATFEARDAIDWPHVDIWWADERWVPVGSSDRNDIELDDVLAAVPLDPERVHHMPAPDASGRGTPEEGADAYAAELAASARRRRDPGDVRATTTEQYSAGKALAPRPAHSVLALDRLRATGFEPVDADEALAGYLAGELGS